MQYQTKTLHTASTHIDATVAAKKVDVIMRD